MSHARSSSASGWRRERFSLSIIVHVVKGRLGINNPGAVVGSLLFLRFVGQFFIRYTFRSSFHQILEPPSIDQWTTKVFAIDIGGWVFLLENWKIFKRTISIEFSLNFFYYSIVRDSIFLSVYFYGFWSREDRWNLTGSKILLRITRRHVGFLCDPNRAPNLN